MIQRPTLTAIVVLLAPLIAMLSPARAASEARSPAADTTITIAVRVHGVRSSQGDLVAVLYGDDAGRFLKKGGRIARQRLPARSGSATLHLPAPRPGTYAVAVYHDENGNRKFDRSLIGLPTEGFGLSRNSTLALGVPRLADAAFPVDRGPAVIDIHLRY